MKRINLLSFRVCLAAILIITTVSEVQAKTIHVDAQASPGGNGSEQKPFRQIQEGANKAQPGDIVLVHGGTYREWVKPPRGGTGENKRIIYRAAPGEKVMIKGSERITGWRYHRGGIWTVKIPNSLFGDYNPYDLNISGGWLLYGLWHHRGDVYYNGEAFIEKEAPEDLYGGKYWTSRIDSDSTTIWARFGEENDPNKALAEINVRESIFFPEISGLKYITVDGFYLMHAAANWAPPVMEMQMGAIGPRMGKHWIIENCHVINARAVGIIIGTAPGVDYDDIDAYGDHIIRNNIIRRCGQAGIAGQSGPTRSLIDGNLIEETNYRREFGGHETAGIKFHTSVDVTIRGNLIRGVYRISQAAHGIWIDFGNQGFRISNNIIYDTEASSIFLEMNHGPMLVDNNILIGAYLFGDSENNVFAHNLFIDCWYKHRTDTRRQSQYYLPHTKEELGRKPGIPANEKWYNNIFIGRGLEEVEETEGYVADFNVYLDGAEKGSFEGENSVEDPTETPFSRLDFPYGTSITLFMNETPLSIKCPTVNAELVGVFPVVGQSLEDRNGDPITVDTDFNGKKFLQPVAGPFSDLKAGLNTIVWGKMIEK